MKLKEMKTDGITFKLLANTNESTTYLFNTPIENYSLTLEISANNIKIAEIPMNQKIINDLRIFIDEVSSKAWSIDNLKDYKLSITNKEWKEVESKAKEIESKNFKDKAEQALNGFAFQELPNRVVYEQDISNR